MARNYLTGPAFENGENLLHGQVREASLKPIQPAADWDLAPRLMQSFFPVTANIWAVVPAGTRPILPHVAPAPTCSTRALAGLLRGAGYKDVPGGKGSHVKFAKDGQPTIVLPGDRRDLSPGVVKTALKVLGNYRLADLQPLLRGAMELPSV
ncbi:MAG: hypothetical protein A49_09130 [Methyloceanibacter sp.]|nr:MAG: hypothetical protein A49_09130 [Methyloceanibacter sp.]